MPLANNKIKSNLIVIDDIHAIMTERPWSIFSILFVHKGEKIRKQL